MAADLTDKLNIVEGQQPGCVIDADRFSRLRRLILFSRAIYAVVAAVLPLFIKIDKFLEKFFKAAAVVLNGVRRHHLPHIRAAGRVAYHSRASADENHRRMAVLLHVHHDDDLHEMPYVQAVGRRVEADIKFYLFFSQQLPNGFVIGGLLDKASFF